MANENTVTDTNYDTIRANLKAYLSSQDVFSDYDFEDSTMAVLLNLLAYNTYYNNIYQSMSTNERFLDSAQLRSSVVSKAKELGYVPRSAKGATASIRLQLFPDNSPSSLSIDKNTTFRTTFDNLDYTFLVPTATSVSPDNNGLYKVDLNIVEGTLITHRFNVSTVNPVQYILPNANIDTDSIEVNIQTSVNDNTLTPYTVAENIIEIDRDSTAYFFQEVDDEHIEIYFGDGVLGKALSDGNIVIVSYRVCSGTNVNGASVFTSSGLIAGCSTYTITTLSGAEGGAEVESINSIKFNAPKNFETQNRAVIANDYSRIILRDNNDIQAISVWGGENNVPPVYGKVYICAKPIQGTKFSLVRKTLLRNEIRQYNMMAVDVEFVDPTYLYVAPTVEVRYDPTRTTSSAGALSVAIESAIQTFEAENLGTFGSRYINSMFINAISDVNSAIESVSINLAMQKRFVPNTSSATTYNITFNNAIHFPHTGHIGSLYSSAFTYGGKTCYFGDDGTGKAIIYYTSSSNTKVTVNSTAGTIDYTTGTVILNNILIEGYEGVELKLYAIPSKSIIKSVRNQLLLIADASITIIDDNTDIIKSEVQQVTTDGISVSLYDSGVTLVTY